MRSLLACLLALGQTASAEPPARIASFSPAATRILVDLGKADRVVAATRWCDLPPDSRARRICDAFEPEVERLIGLKPDAVIVPRLANPLLAERLRHAGFRVTLLAEESPDSPAADIRTLGNLTRTESRAAELVAHRRQLRPTDGRRVLVIWDGSVAGPESYVAWVIRAAGGIPAPREGRWSDWDPEAAALTNPDLVLYLREGGPSQPEVSQRWTEEWRVRAGLRITNCSIKGYIFELNPGSAWLPGSGLPEAAHILAELMHRTK